MATILLEGENESTMNLLLALAQKLGVQRSILNKSDLEDIKLAQLMEKERTGNYVQEEEVFYKLNKK